MHGKIWLTLRFRFLFILVQGVYRFLLGLYRRPILSVCIKTAKARIKYLTYKTKNRRHSVDTEFRNRAGSISFSLLLIKVPCMWFINVCDQMPCRETIMQSQTLLMYCWYTFSEWGRECVSFSFVYKWSLYLIYKCLHPIANQITQDARPKIIGSPLTLIFRMGQGACLTCFWL